MTSRWPKLIPKMRCRWGWVGPPPDAVEDLAMAQTDSKAVLPMGWGWPTTRRCQRFRGGPNSFQSSAADQVRLAHREILPIASRWPHTFPKQGYLWGVVGLPPDIADDLAMAQTHSKDALPMGLGWPTSRRCRGPRNGPN